MTSCTSSGIFWDSPFSFIHKYLRRCPGPGSFPSSSDCSHFWECLGEDQVRPKCFSGYLCSLSQLLGSSSCPDGLWFEPSTGECATPDKVSFFPFLLSSCFPTQNSYSLFQVGCIEINEKISSWNISARYTFLSTLFIGPKKVKFYRLCEHPHIPEHTGRFFTLKV